MIEMDRTTMLRRELDDSTAALAHAAIEFFDTHEEDILHYMKTCEGVADDVHQVRALIGAVNRKRNALQAAQQH
jgi:hypothetical protein